MKRAVLLGLFALVCLGIAGIVSAQAQPAATVVGSVINGTTADALPVGAPVTLQFFKAGELTTLYTTTLSAEGTFRFDDLEAEVGSDFVTQIVYKDIAYFSELAHLQAGDPETAVEIVIFEPSQDRATVQVDQVHFFIVPLAEYVHIAEYYLLGNTGNRAYVGEVDAATGEHKTLTFTPPSEAVNLNFEGTGLGERYLGDMEQFSDTRAIPPGTATLEVEFSYELPYHEGMEVTRSVVVPVKSIVLIVSSESLGIEGLGVTFSGMINTQMGAAASYTAGPLAAGERLTFHFVPQTARIPTQNRSPMPASASQPRSASQEIAIGVLALLVVGLVSYYGLWRTHPLPPVPDAVRPLIADLAALDACYEAGEISESDYEKARTALKDKAVVMLLELSKRQI